MLFPLYTHVRVPAGVHHYVAKIADKLVDYGWKDGRWRRGHISIDVDICVVEEDFDGVILKPNYRQNVHSSEREIYPAGDHTKIVDRHTDERFIFLDSMVQGKIVQQ